MPRARASRELPPPLELACLNALWTLGESSVRKVQEALAARGLAYTTVMTLLERLVRRGAAARRKDGRAFVYSAVTARNTLRRIAVRELIDGHFGGSRDELLAYLQGAPVGHETVTPEPDSALDPALL